MFKFLKKQETIELLAVCDGEIKHIEDVPDPVFAEKMMGDGIAVMPTSNTILSPVAGTVVVLMDTAHAVGIKTEQGIELLIHIGLETVNLKGQGFEPLVKINDQIEAGQPLIQVDLDFLKEKQINPITPIVIVNANDYKYELAKTGETVTAGSDIIIKFTKHGS